jgi:RNA polymerase-binding transcription factor DksA
MTTRRGWRAWLAAAVPVGLAGLATLAFGRGNGGHFVPPRDPGGRGAQAVATTEGQEPSLLLPAWRTLLETRWQQRLGAVTRLSLAYHDAAGQTDGRGRAGDQPGSPELRRLMREAVAARRALSDTEEALARLSAGTYGRCEQCAAAIPAGRLRQEPEARYCERCVRQAMGQPAALPA